MGRRRDDDKSGDTFGIIEREAQGERTAPGMTDHDGATDAKPIENLTQHRRLVGGRTALVLCPFAPALARPIDQNDAMRSGEPLPESKPHVFEVAARTVKKNDRQRMIFSAVLAQLC